MRLHTIFHSIIFTTLFTSLWRLCHCADQDDDRVSIRSRAGSRGNIACPGPLGKDTLDLSKPHASICKSFEVDVGGVSSLMFVIEPKVNVTKIVHGHKHVWRSSDDKRCLYCIVFLKDAIPSMIAVVLRNSEKLFQMFFKFKHNKWQKSKKKYVDKINALKTEVEEPTRHLLDISCLKDDDKAKVLSSYIGGIKAYCFYPRPGNVIEKVMHGTNDIWEAVSGQRCFFCNLMHKDDVMLLLVAVNNGKKNYSMRFQKIDGEWRYLRVTDFARKVAEMNGEPVAHAKQPVQAVAASDYLPLPEDSQNAGQGNE